MPRGGRRSGTPGTAYGNRTDLNQPVPIRTGPSQQYGQNADLIRQQQAVPMAPQPTAAPADPNAPPPLYTPPGGIVPLDAPTQRPDEHVMTGASVGAGAGPEVLPSQQPNDPVVTGLGILNALGANVPPEIAHLREQLGVHATNAMTP